MKNFKFYSILFYFLLLNTCLYSQSESPAINIENPIYKFDAYYAPDDRLVFKLILNTVKSFETVTPISFEAQVTADIDWGASANIEDKISTKIYAVFIKDNSDFIYTADVKYGNNELLYDAARKNWKKLDNAKLKFRLSNIDYELPLLTIHPPINRSNNTSIINIKSFGEIIDSNKVSIEVLWEGVPFIIKKIWVSYKLDGSSTPTSFEIDANANMNTINGLLTLELQPRNITFNVNTQYTFKLKAQKAGTNEIMESPSHIVTFIDRKPRKLLDETFDYSVVIQPEQKEVIIEVNTKGENGLFGIKFNSHEYSSKIKVSTIQQGSLFSFRLNNCENILNNSSSTFNFTTNGKDISPEYKISKKGFKIEQFKFTSSNNSELAFEFNAPEYTDIKKLNLIMTGNKGINLDVSDPNQFKKTSSGKLKVDLPISIVAAITQDTIINSTIILKYDMEPIFELGVDFVNQKLVNEKFAKLISEVSNRKRVNKENIKLLIADIVSIGQTIGNSIEKEDVNKAIEDLVSNNKEKIKLTIAEIGKWAVVIGKIAIPILI